MVIFLCGCSGNDNKAANLADTSVKKDTPQVTIPGNESAVDTVPAKYLKLFPDTTRSFTDLKELSAYIQPIKTAFLSIKTASGKTLQFDDSEISVSVKKEFDKATSALFLKHAKKWSNTAIGISLLEIHADIATEEKLALFEQFPEKIREGNIGKRVYTALSQYTYKRNIGFDFSKFSNQNIIQPDQTVDKLKKLLHHSKKYTLVMFGASWCHPCLVQERALKNKYNTIDTSAIQVVGISIDASQAAYKKYIEQENFPWQCYRIEGGEDNPFFKQLGFTPIPRNFLIDSSGKVLKEHLDVFELLK